MSATLTGRIFFFAAVSKTIRNEKRSLSRSLVSKDSLADLDPPGAVMVIVFTEEESAGEPYPRKRATHTSKNAISDESSLICVKPARESVRWS